MTETAGTTVSERRRDRPDEDLSSERRARKDRPQPDPQKIARKLGRTALRPERKEMLGREAGRVAVERTEREARVAREVGPLATERARDDERDRPRESER
jgi:hypothetical protein